MLINFLYFICQVFCDQINSISSTNTYAMSFSPFSLNLFVLWIIDSTVLHN
uniref:Uncharacterized protein n=1 Tax=Anguilla anguilla TaxID=7936 RepID=A0A0E9X628_ANGAN